MAAAADASPAQFGPEAARMKDYAIDPKFFEHLKGLVLKMSAAMVEQVALSGPEQAG